jgi:hypothetical protein
MKQLKISNFSKRMKQVIALLLLLLALRCAKVEHEYTYAVNCQFPIVFSGAKLVVTKPRGEVMQVFDIQSGSTSFSKKFSYVGKEAPEKYDLHLIESSICDAFVVSFLDVENGASVYFQPSSSVSLGAPKWSHLQISGVETYSGEIEVTDSPSPFLYIKYFQSEKILKVAFANRENQGVVLQLKANGESQRREIALPDTLLLKDTAYVSWQDFKPLTAPVEIGLPSNELVRDLKVYTVSPDFKHSILLREFSTGMNDNQPFPANFSHPASLSEPVSYYISVEQEKSAFQKIFQPGEELRFAPLGMEIGDVSINGTTLSVEASGDINLLRASSSFISTSANCGIYWQINGRPSSFQNCSLITLADYLPSWINQENYLIEGAVWAYQFEKYNYEQVREGFPFRLDEPFALARSGYKAVWKWY